MARSSAGEMPEKRARVEGNSSTSTETFLFAKMAVANLQKVLYNKNLKKRLTNFHRHPPRDPEDSERCWRIGTLPAGLLGARLDPDLEFPVRSFSVLRDFPTALLTLKSPNLSFCNNLLENRIYQNTFFLTEIRGKYRGAWFLRKKSS